MLQADSKLARVSKPDEDIDNVNEPDRLIAAEPHREDAQERAMRPKKLTDYHGQRAVTEQMDLFISAAKRRSEALDHVLIFGPPGLGKTTLANIIANELDVRILHTSGQFKLI